jgi:ATP-dependent Clp protease ATP-binding subunit ClpC
MSEYMEKHNVSRLVGAPPGYVGYEEGGQLTEKIRRQPYAVVLFDEIEKAHSDVFNMLLQIMEEGRLTDSFGRRVDFRNTIIIMTSNLGGGAIKDKSTLGFRQVKGSADKYEELKSMLTKEVEKTFRPEFLNRLDDVIVFHPLEKEDLKYIIDIEAHYVKERLAAHGIELIISNEAKDFILSGDYNLDFGARPIKRAIERLIEDHMSEEILRGAYDDKNRVEITVKNDHLYFDATMVEKQEEAEEKAVKEA